MNKEQRHTYIIKEAYKLARSGNYRNYQAIEIKIRAEGYEDAQTFLDDQRIRDELDSICEHAQSKREGS
jgi:hypothetical protein